MAKLNIRDEKFRDQVLYGPIWPVIIKVCMPLALYQAVTQLFNILDTIMASAISSEAVSTVVYMVQLQHIVAAVGGGLAVGGTIIISRNYGKGDYDEVRKNLSTLIALAAFFALLVIISLPFIPFILRIAGTPETFIESGSEYFMLSMISVILNYFNSIYIAIEKSRGESKKIVILNFIQITLKLSLTALFIYILNGTILHIAIATIISYSVVFIYALFSLTHTDDAFSFSIKAISIKKNTILPILNLSFPSMVEKMTFSLGKAEVNKMAAGYGAEAVGAAGISNNMSGMLTGWQYGVMDGGTALLGQLKGHDDLERTIKAYRRIQLTELLIGLIGIILMHILTVPIAKLFSIAKGNFNEEFFNMIIKTFGYELFGCMLLSLFYASNPILLATGRTKLTLAVNLCRIFLFRIPIIYYFSHYTSLDYSAVGLTVAISNSLTGLVAFITGELVIRRERQIYSKTIK